MSAPTPQGEGFAARLPAWLRPRERELPGEGRTRLIETTVLLLVALALAIATVNDVVLQTHVNHRLVADLRTWRLYTRHDFKEVGIEQDFYGHTTRDIACGDTVPGAPKARTQICLQIAGPVLHGRRQVRGGWYLAPYVQDFPTNRYGCFGAAKRDGLCAR